jgi:dihydrodipicolinate synthase/N-acetylneuraminate lyase
MRDGVHDMRPVVLCGKTDVLCVTCPAVLKEGPAIIYNVPGRTGQDIPDDIVQSIASHPNFLGMKECTGNERIGNHTKKARAQTLQQLARLWRQCSTQPLLWCSAAASLSLALIKHTATAVARNVVGSA